MKMFEWGIKNAVSIEGDRLHPVQTMLLKRLGLDIEFIFCWDKGKSKEFVLNQIKQMKNKMVYYLLDNPDNIPGMDRFNDKESPIDRTYEDFLDLYEKDKYKLEKSAG
jgi:DNA primase